MEDIKIEVSLSYIEKLRRENAELWDVNDRLYTKIAKMNKELIGDDFLFFKEIWNKYGFEKI